MELVVHVTIATLSAVTRKWIDICCFVWYRYAILKKNYDIWFETKRLLFYICHLQLSSTKMLHQANLLGRFITIAKSFVPMALENFHVFGINNDSLFQVREFASMLLYDNFLKMQKRNTISQRIENTNNTNTLFNISMPLFNIRLCFVTIAIDCHYAPNGFLKSPPVCVRLINGAQWCQLREEVYRIIYALWKAPISYITNYIVHI